LSSHAHNCLLFSLSLLTPCGNIAPFYFGHRLPSARLKPFLLKIVGMFLAAVVFRSCPKFRCVSVYDPVFVFFSMGVRQSSLRSLFSFVFVCFFFEISARFPFPVNTNTGCTQLHPFFFPLPSTQGFAFDHCPRLLTRFVRPLPFVFDFPSSLFPPQVFSFAQCTALRCLPCSCCQTSIA